MAKYRVTTTIETTRVVEAVNPFQAWFCRRQRHRRTTRRGCRRSRQRGQARKEGCEETQVTVA